jgi:hypothetical protein
VLINQLHRSESLRSQVTHLAKKWRFITMKGTIFWDITPCSLLKANRRFRATYRSASHLLLCWFLVQRIFRPWRWRRYVSPERQLTFNGLDSVIYRTHHNHLCENLKSYIHYHDHNSLSLVPLWSHVCLALPRCLTPSDFLTRTSSHLGQNIFSGRFILIPSSFMWCVCSPLVSVHGFEDIIWASFSSRKSIGRVRWLCRESL